MLVRVFLAIVDDALRGRVSALLDRPHVHVVTLRSPGSGPTEVFERLTSESYDIGIVDRLPGDDAGAELLARVRRLPDRPAMLLLAADADPQQRAEWLAAGVVAVLDASLPDETLGATLQTFIARRRQERLDRLAAARRTRKVQASFVSESPALQQVMEMARRVAAADSPVLILGETGVGKERLAMFLHEASRRSQGPFVAVNCAAIPAELFESELFGHHRGAFTGAIRTRRGKFEMADQGTIFLDEVGEVPLHLQAKLLRVLQEGRIAPVGSDEPVEIETRVVAATNRDLQAEMDAGRFRRDLYYRLSVVELTIPPLRERPEDLPTLAETYLREFRAQFGREVQAFRPDAMRALCGYGWPGNVRELVNVVERAVLLCRGEEIGLEDLPDSVASFADGTVVPVVGRDDTPTPQPHPGAVSLPQAWLEHPWRKVREALLREGERAYLDSLLRQTRGRIGPAAERAGFSARSLFEKMRRHGLRKEDYR